MHNIIKNKSFLFVVFIALFSSSQSLWAAAGGDFTLDSNEGKISLKQFKGDVVYVDFWASWCTPCRKSFPWMNKMHAKYEEEGLKIIGISLDTKNTMTQKFLIKNPALFTIAYDPDGKVADDYKVQVMPTSYLIGRDGELLLTHKGFRSKHKEALEEEIKKALKK